MEVFDPANNTWARKADMGSEEDAARPLMKEERHRRAGQAAREQLGGASRQRGS